MKRAIKASSSGEGWDEEYLDEIFEVLDSIYNLSYELKTCVRGAYTRCHTYSELARYIETLGENLTRASEELEDAADEYDSEFSKEW